MAQSSASSKSSADLGSDVFNYGAQPDVAYPFGLASGLPTWAIGAGGAVLALVLVFVLLKRK